MTPVELAETGSGRVIETHATPEAALMAFQQLPEARRRSVFVRFQPLPLAEAERAAMARVRGEYAA